MVFPDLVEETVDDQRLGWPGRQFEGYKNYLREQTYELLLTEMRLEGERDSTITLLKTVKTKRETVNQQLDTLKEDKAGIN